jgi:hypothetical protein
MAQGTGCRVCWALSLAWVLAVAALAVTSWPHLPLDMSPTDPATVAAYRGAVLRHAGLYASIALSVPLVAWLLSRRAG